MTLLTKTKNMYDPDLNLRVFSTQNSLTRNTTIDCHDLIYIPEFLCNENNLFYYDLMLKHDSDLLCHNIVQSVEKTLPVKITKTRLNFFETDDYSCQTTPFHRDFPALIADSKENICVTVSLGSKRKITFRQYQTRKNQDDPWQKINKGTTINLECNNGSLYAFARDVNVEWEHAICPSYGELSKEDPHRISFVCWGVTTNTMSKKGTRVSTREIPSAKELGLS